MTHQVINLSAIRMNGLSISTQIHASDGSAWEGTYEALKQWQKENQLMVAHAAEVTSEIVLGTDVWRERIVRHETFVKVRSGELISQRGPVNV